MEAHVLRLHFLAPKSPLLVTFSVSPSAHSPLLRLQRRPLYIRATSASGDDDGSPPLGQPITPPETVNIRFRRRSRKRRQQRDGVGEATARAVEAKQPAKAKSWEEMSLQEKAMELYVGEKGLLFWLNKLAYASIFAVIGGWIVFRFVGPSLNLYQLDSPPLSPTSLFKG